MYRIYLLKGIDDESELQFAERASYVSVWRAESNANYMAYIHPETRITQSLTPSDFSSIFNSCRYL